MWRVGTEPKTPLIRKLRDKLREKEWACGIFIPQPPFLKRKKRRGKERKYYGSDGDRTRVPQIWKMKLSSLISD